jgi:hypothetical protein
VNDYLSEEAARIPRISREVLVAGTGLCSGGFEANRRSQVFGAEYGRGPRRTNTAANGGNLVIYAGEWIADGCVEMIRILEPNHRK